MRLCLLILMVATLAGCAVNPATGRTDFVMMSESQELSIGRDAHQQILKQYPRYPDEALQAYVQQVGERVARHSHRGQLDYHFTVIDSPDINAFALPGGYIYIHRGLMAYLSSEAELAAVLGHEVGHVTARHGVRQQSQSTAWGILGQAVAMGTGVGAAADVTGVLGNAVVRGYGRDMELEADGLGAQYLARAGYDPQAMIEVVKVLKLQEDFVRDQAAARGEQQPVGSYHGLFDTHPDNDRRLQQVIGPARALVGGEQEVNREVFLKHLQGLPFGDSAESGIRRGERFYHRDLDFTLAFAKGWSIINEPQQLVGRSPDKQVLVAMTLEDNPRGLEAASLLKQRIGGRRLLAGEALQQAGLQGYTGLVEGNVPRRVAVILKGDKAYLFVGAVKGRAASAAEDAQMLAAINSFRPLLPAERKLAEPLRLQLVRVTAGQTIKSFAAGSGLASDAEATLRLLNTLYPQGEPRPGEWFKTVR
ncbi:putative Zn-dependent protease [Pseudomonas sp. URMO17WK12:I1]|uniref:M48 family metalloprotease n=1 Tax=unclassified Pseudomonas TaxID=196821 RepID=UPI00048845A9|nr:MULTISPECIES: M48 family metalloprotease [unclassified Pseudomonas]PZW67068.1 putative Zn-dependent protease [Pseudomonas sp. URMO17WK12:I1]